MSRIRGLLFSRSLYCQVSKLKKEECTLLPPGDHEGLVEEAENFDDRKFYIAKGFEDDGFDSASILSSYFGRI